MPHESEKTIPIEDDTTEPNPVVRKDLTIPVEHLEIATDVDVLRGAKDTLEDENATPKELSPLTAKAVTPPPSCKPVRRE